MSLIKLNLEDALHGYVKRKSNRTANLKIAAKKIVDRYAQTVVKITKFDKAASGGGKVKDNLRYISRNGKLELEDNNGNIIKGGSEVNALAKDWEDDFKNTQGRKDQRAVMRMILSMPSSVEPESVRLAVREFTKDVFHNYEYVFSLHTDEDHPHCHVAVKCLGFDGKRLNPRKEDLELWREKFAEKLLDQGVYAEASPRRSRGVILKPVNKIVKQIEKERINKPQRVAKVTALKMKEAANDLTDESKGKKEAPKSWMKAIITRRHQIERSWLAAAADLEQQAEPSDRELAEKIRQFVKDMPPIKTERDLMKDNLLTRFKGKLADLSSDNANTNENRSNKLKDRDIER